MGLEMEPKLSVGNVITIIVLLVTVVGAWYGMLHTVQATSSQITAIQMQATEQRREFADLLAKQQSEFNGLVAAHEARIRALEITQATLRTELGSIGQGVDRVEAGIKALQER